ncbi:NAD(P)H-dependent oxidoreductase [Candidatus Saccharibacteria bacterium]|nr:NAD(P)H-dependent oxidoreductase [Candidatus Saccharibacteria bacterium]MCB9834419.1 NAD(P)H-dependent oxidoreductase [Candidatus Nomurabacteria bacterium]
MKNLLIIEGSVREKRRSIYAAKYIEKLASKDGRYKVKLICPEDYPSPHEGNDPDNKNPGYTKLTEWADAFLLVLPEYNHSFAGSLKMLLDTELSNYLHKPVAFAGVSVGGFGGVRAIESILSAVRQMGMVALSIDIHFSNSYGFFDEQTGEPIDDSKQKEVGQALDELHWMAERLG